ncbi:hypothetical protein ACA910_007566 [Epithemia clementina (nom. ined.)]
MCRLTKTKCKSSVSSSSSPPSSSSSSSSSPLLWLSLRWRTNHFLGTAFVAALLLSAGGSFSAGWCCRCQALDNGLARVPPMGWNAWNAFGCHNTTQDIMVQAADQIVHLGLRESGYQYVNLDDCWSARQQQQPRPANDSNNDNDNDNDNDKLIGDPT